MEGVRHVSGLFCCICHKTESAKGTLKSLDCKDILDPNITGVRYRSLIELPMIAAKDCTIKYQVKDILSFLSILSTCFIM